MVLMRATDCERSMGSNSVSLIWHGPNVGELIVLRGSCSWRQKKRSI